MLESMLIAAKCSDVGVVREVNEDSAIIEVLHPPGADEAHPLILAAVADGMGGHASGEVASCTAVDTFRETMIELLSAGATSDSEITKATIQAIKDANTQVYQAGQGDAELRGMGTTITTVIVAQGVLCLGHVGDSRAYLIRMGTARQLTKDHTVVQYKLDQGLITQEEADQSTERNMLRRAIGIRPQLEVDTAIEELRDGDVIILCSDGLYGSVEEADLIDAVKNNPNPQQICDSLVALAKERDGSDNITVVCLMQQPVIVESQVAPTLRKASRKGKIILGIILLLVLSIIGFTVSQMKVFEKKVVITGDLQAIPKVPPYEIYTKKELLKRINGKWIASDSSSVSNKHRVTITDTKFKETFGTINYDSAYDLIRSDDISGGQKRWKLKTTRGRVYNISFPDDDQITLENSAGGEEITYKREKK